MFGKLGDLGSIMGQMKELRNAQKQLKKITAEVEKENIKVVVNGEMTVVELVIGEKVDVKKAGKLIKDIINEAFHKVQVESAQKITGLASGLKIPGLG